VISEQGPGSPAAVPGATPGASGTAPAAPGGAPAAAQPAGGRAPALALGAASLRVEPVRAARDLDAFLALPWRIYAGDPAWVPPLLSEQRKALDRRRHPFHLHAEVECYLARRDRRVVGRIAAIVNRQHLQFHGERAGFFGLFESEPDPEVAAALLRAAEDAVRRRGMERIRGPMNFSTNDEVCSPGVLVEGHDRPPAVLMAHTPPYYAGLLEAAGYRKAKDLLAYWLDGPEPPERLVQGVARAQRAEGIEIRPLNLRRFQDEVRTIQEIYHSAWEKNWGFVPMTAEEFEHLARELRPLVHPRLCLIAEVRGEPAGFALALPDYNQVLRRLDGRLGPIGLVKFLWYRRRIDAARVLTLGLKPQYRRTGLDAMLYLRLFQEGPRIGYTRAECSWILEDNWDMRRGLERLGARVHKVYRVYEKEL